MTSLSELVFAPAMVTRAALEQFEPCGTVTVLGDGRGMAERPVTLSWPVCVAPHEDDALDESTIVAFARATRRAGSMLTLSAGHLRPDVRRQAGSLAVRVRATRGGLSPDAVRSADAIQLELDGRLHPDFTGLDDLPLKLEELREASLHRVPIIIKVAATRPYVDVAAAARSGADVIALENLETERRGPAQLVPYVPITAAIAQARRALDETGSGDRVKLLAYGGFRCGEDVAKALALGADCVGIRPTDLCGQLIPRGAAEPDAGERRHAELDIEAQRIADRIAAIGAEVSRIARACGKSDVHHLDAEDLRSRTLSGSLLSGVALAGVDHPAADLL